MESSKELVIQELMRLLPHADIEHHIPGRIRLKIRPSGFGVAMSMDPDALAGAVPGIKSVRANLLARSVVIEYDLRRISMELWESLRSLHSHPGKSHEMKEKLAALWD